eukprot:s3667_g12.t1
MPRVSPKRVMPRVSSRSVMPRVSPKSVSQECVLLAVVYGAVCATGSLPHPVSLWPLDEKEAEAKAQAMCKAIRQVIPTRAQYLLQPSDVTNNKGGLIPALLAVIFMLNSTLPCSCKHEVLHSASFAIQSAVAQEVYKEPRKKMKGQSAQELSFTPMDLPTEPVPDAQQRKRELQKRIQMWLIEPDDTFNFDAPTMADPVVKSIFQQIEAMAGPWAMEHPQDFSLLLKEDEVASTLLALPAHELLLRWVNFHLKAFRGDPDAGLLNLGELDLPLLVELLTKLAPDVMNLHEEEQTALRMAHNPTAAEAASLNLVTQVATRCTGYEILTEEVLNDEQTDMMASFLAELMASGRAQLRVRKGSEIGQHMEMLASIVLEAANTQNSQLVSGLCSYLRDHQQSLTAAASASDDRSEDGPQPGDMVVTGAPVVHHPPHPAEVVLAAEAAQGSQVTESVAATAEAAEAAETIVLHTNDQRLQIAQSLKTSLKEFQPNICLLNQDQLLRHACDLATAPDWMKESYNTQVNFTWALAGYNVILSSFYRAGTKTPSSVKEVTASMKVPDPAIIDEAKNLMQQMPRRDSIPPRWQVVARMQEEFS